ncbi:MAG: SET domain-containing protein [Bacteriovoracaceae bacterium]
MIIPSVRVKYLSDEKGYGLIATERIPKGTVTFVQDGLDIVISETQIEVYPEELLDHINKYSYEDYLGNRIISWDLAKYMNHDDDANTLTTGYGFEIAIKDIEIGQEVTDDYRIFSTHHDTTFKVTHGPLQDLKPWPRELITYWDEEISDALLFFEKVNQPLLSLISKDVINDVSRYLSANIYRSVNHSLPLRYIQLTSSESKLHTP